MSFSQGVSMKRLLIATVASIALGASSALAADLAPYYKAPSPPAPAVSWTGCYLDGGVGYGMFSQDEYLTAFGVSTATVTDGGRGWLGRVGGGCDYQLGGQLSNWVIGAFGDYDFENIHGWNDLGSSLVTGNEKQNAAWAVGGRLGYLVTPKLLTYTDGGYTEARFNAVTFTSVLGGPAFATIPSHTYNGWFLGGGTEYALDFSWLPIHGLFWRNEYRYSSFSSANLPLSALGIPTG
ncbi:MAG: outer membrane protein, partial [Xanthobacteraceae bacterium]